MFSMVSITNEKINVAEELAGFDYSEAGSVVVHIGVVKSDPDGKKSKGLTFKPKGDVEAELLEIEKDLRQKFKIIEIKLVRRMGTLEVGDEILLAAIACKGREDAFGACREAVERYKKMKTIDKTELLVD